MTKVTKKSLMIDALDKHTSKQIEKAEYCEVNVVDKNGTPLT